MPKRSHDELGIVHELFKLALFLLGDMSGRRIVSVLDDIPVGFDRKIAELVLKIAYLSRTEGVVGGGEHYSFRPVVLIGIPLMLHKAVEYTLTVLPDASLSYVSDVLPGVIGNAKKEINSLHFRSSRVLHFSISVRGILYATPVQLASVHLIRPLASPSIRKRFMFFPRDIVISPYRLMNFQLL